MIVRVKSVVTSGGRRLDDLAATLLGESLPPAPWALDAAGWRPDPPDAYCRRCGDSVGAGEASDAGCASCRTRVLHVDRLVRLGRYGPPLREWITAIKYEQRWAEMAVVLGAVLGAEVRKQAQIDAARSIVVPMPMPWLRRLHRGIDHARLLAEAVARQLGTAVAQPLARANVTPQVALARGDRRRTGARGLRLRRGVARWWPAEVDVVLVDDVRTTGASLAAASRLIRRRRPRRILAAVIAVVDDPSRRHADGPLQGGTNDPNISPV